MGEEGGRRLALTFLGTAGAVPEPGRETASYLVDGRLQVDCGWQGALRLLSCGVRPDDVDWLLFTHCHHDHYLGLASLLFWRVMRGDPARTLRVAGPEGEVQRVVAHSWELLQPARFFPGARAPEVVGLRAGQDVEIAIPALPQGRRDSAAHTGALRLRLRTCASRHAVPGLCYRFTEPVSGADFTLGGDTAYHPPLAELARGSQLLVHEASWGARARPPAENDALHASAPEAAQIARAAGVRRLYLVHAEAAAKAESLRAARAIFPETYWPGDGETVLLPP